DGSLHGGGIGHVSRERQDPPRQLLALSFLGQRFEQVCAPRDDRNVIAHRGKHQRRRPPDPRAAAGDQDGARRALCQHGAPVPVNHASPLAHLYPRSGRAARPQTSSRKSTGEPLSMSTRHSTVEGMYCASDGSVGIVPAGTCPALIASTSTRFGSTTVAKT